MSKSLLETCNITTGKLDSNAATIDGKYPFFTCAPNPLRIDNYAFDDDVILLAGNNAQGNFHIARYTGKFNAYQRTYVITAKDQFDIDFIKYSIELSLNHLKKVAQGSQTKFLTMGILEQFEVNNIPYDKQKEQVSCLAAIDKKIALNNHVNATLEAMAKTLYDYWFVQFDFPDEKGRPYKTSGGKMVYNEKLGREIPAGWEVKRLLDIATLFDSERIPLSSKEREVKKGTIPYYGATGILDYVDEAIFDGVYLLIAEDGSVEMPNGSLVLQYIWGKAWVNNHAHILQGIPPYSTEYLFLALRHIKTRQLMTGSIQKKVTQDNLKSIQLVCPSNPNIFILFQKYISTFFDMYKRCCEENRRLVALRDWLLPMLMNGQVGFRRSNE